MTTAAGCRPTHEDAVEAFDFFHERRLHGQGRRPTLNDIPGTACQRWRRLEMDEEQEPAGRRSKVIKRILLGSAATVVLVALAGGSYWALTCPCEGTPGFILRGELYEEPVTDWGFANDVQLCQIQISIRLRPHSVNLNCMATPEGDLFLSCSFGVSQVLVPAGGDEPLGPLTPRWGRVPCRAEPGDGPLRARGGLGRQSAEAPESRRAERAAPWISPPSRRRAPGELVDLRGSIAGWVGGAALSSRGPIAPFSPLPHQHPTGRKPRYFLDLRPSEPGGSRTHDLPRPL